MRSGETEGEKRVSLFLHFGQKEGSQGQSSFF